MKKFLIIPFLFVFSFAIGQVTIKDTSFVVTGSTTPWYIRMAFPTGFDSRVTDSTKIIYFMPGVAEVGAGTNTSGSSSHLGKYGFFHSSVGLGSTWDGSVVLGNGVHNDVVYVEVIPPIAWPAVASVDAVVQRINPRFRVRVNSFYVIGFSRGYNAFARYATWLPYNQGTKKYKMVTAIHSTRGHTAGDADGLPIGYPQKFGRFAKLGGRALMLVQYNDVRENDRVAKNMLDSVPGSVIFYWTNFTEKRSDGTNIDHHGAGINYPFRPNFRNYTPRSVLDTTIYASRPGGSSYLPNSQQLANPNQNIYQILLRMGDTTLNSAPGESVVINTVSDTIVLYPQWTWLRDPITLSATVASGTPTTWTWTRVSGPNTPIITNSNQRIAQISGYVPGYYRYNVTASNGSSSNTKTVTIWVRDLMQKNVTTPRATPQVFHLGDVTGNGVSTTNIYVPYLNSYFQTRYGTTPRAGDTIYIHRNPNNSGVWTEIEIGDIGGSREKPIIVEPYLNPLVIAGTRWRVGIRDSNIVCFTKFNGMGLKEKGRQNSPYGFIFNGTSSADYGFVANHFHDIELNGYAIRDAEVGVFAKVNSTETNYYKQFKYFSHNRIVIHDVSLKNINGEGFYVGNTEVNGAVFGAGPSVRGDSLDINRIAIYNTGWDGLQIANWGYGNKVRDIALYKTGQRNMGSQQWSAFIGGNTQGDMWNIASYNSTGGVAALGQGKVRLYNIYVDSANNGAANVDGIYVSQSNTGTLDVYSSIDSMQVTTFNNYIGATTRRGIFHANNNGSMKKGAIRNNYFLSGANSGAISNAQDTIELNTTGSATVASRFGDSAFYKVLQVLRSNPDSMVSFFDVETSTPVTPPAPTTSAGSNQTIILPTNTVTLTGTATAGSGATISSTVWTKVSGGEATITNPGNRSTTVTGLVAGTYVFRITATDNYSQTSYSQVTIIVNPALAGPTVNAGATQIITLPTNSVTLSGTASAGSGTISSTTWSKVGGGAATIMTPNSLTTSITGMVAGTYTFRLTVTNSNSLTATHDVTITVNPENTTEVKIIIQRGMRLTLTVD